MSEQSKRKNSRSHGALNTRLIALRAQRKIACSFPNQTKRLFLDEITCHLLDTLHQLIWHYTNSKKRTDTLVKQLIKTNVKLHVIVMSTGVKQQQEESITECREMLRTAALCLIRHVNSTSTEETCDLARIQAALRTAGTFARAIAEGHMSQKSLDKLADIVMFMSDGGFLTALTSKQPPYNHLVIEIAQDLQDSIDRGIL
nr:tumor necrosis factor alpha induced protein [Hymenolepis microstoma]